MKTNFDIVDINGMFAIRVKNRPFEEMKMIRILINSMEQQNENYIKKKVKNDKDKIIKEVK